MFGQYIRPYVERFCQGVSIDHLVQMAENREDVYHIWLDQFSSGEKPPRIAGLFREQIKDEMKRVMAEVCPEYYRVFDANPSWAERQLDGLFVELFS